MGGFLHLKPTVGCQISTIYFSRDIHRDLPPQKKMQISKLIFETLLWASGAETTPGTEVHGWVSTPQAHSRVSNINFDI
jgi:hypothetical protein